jgi:hypothetical protein
MVPSAMMLKNHKPAQQSIAFRTTGIRNKNPALRESTSRKALPAASFAMFISRRLTSSSEYKF